MSWYIGRDGERRGPFDEQTLTAMVARGDVRPDDLVWHTGDAGWRAAREVPGLFVPPPLETDAPPRADGRAEAHATATAPRLAVVTDSSFDRLRNAWSAAASKRAVDAVKERVGALVANATNSSPGGQGGVLWISVGAGGTPPIAVTSARRRMNYRIACVQPNPSDDFDALLKQHQPRLLVADVDWCAAIGEAAVRELHRHHPQIDWLLRWDEPSPRWLETLVHSGARGVLLRTADSIELARAFDAVVGGEIWMPRRVLQWLYATLIDAPRQDPNSALGPSTLPLDSDLTARETEVAALLRQGLTNHDIAKRLNISIKTVKKRRQRA